MLLKLIAVLCCLACGGAVIGTELPFFPSVLLGVGVWLGTFAALVLVCAAVLAVCCAFVRYDEPQTEDSPFYRKLAAVYIEALISLLRVRIHTAGLENTPKDGRFLLVCNHQFEVDPGVLLYCFPDSQLAFISKQENRRLPFVGKIMHKLLCQLIDREDDRQALRSIINCINILKEDKASIAVFPEGGIKVKGKLSHFRPGVFKIATKAKVPIVVCTLRNTQCVLQNALRFRPTDVVLHLAGVVEPEEYEGMKTPQISAKVYDMMLADLGPGYAIEE